MSVEQNNATPAVNMDMSTLENHQLCKSLSEKAELLKSKDEEVTEAELAKYRKEGFDSGHIFIGFACQRVAPDRLDKVTMAAQVAADVRGSGDLLVNALVSHMESDPSFAKVILNAAKNHTIMNMMKRGGHSAQMAEALMQDERPITQITNINPEGK